jgi:hypothetical protein
MYTSKKYVFPLIEKNEMGDVFWVCYNIELNQKCLKELKNARQMLFRWRKKQKECWNIPGLDKTTSEIRSDA